MDRFLKYALARDAGYGPKPDGRTSYDGLRGNAKLNLHPKLGFDKPVGASIFGPHIRLYGRQRPPIMEGDCQRAEE